MNTTPSVSEEMVKAGVEALHTELADVEPDDKAIVRAIYLAMKASEPYAGQTDVERVIAQADRIYERCKCWPETTEDGMVALIELRNLYHEKLRAALLVSNRSGVE